MAFHSTAMPPTRAFSFLVATLLALATHCRAEFNFEVGLRVQERLAEFTATPANLLSVVSRGQTNGAFPSSPDRDAFLLLGDALLQSYPHWMVYYGLETGELTGNFHTPRLGEYREPGNGGYLVEEGGESNVHYNTCVSENGTAVPCRMSVGDQYVACIDDCKLQPCENDDESQAQVDCSVHEEGGDERAKCEEQLTWCEAYEIKSVTESDPPRGYIPLYEYCLGETGLPSQAEGEIYKFHDGVAGSCYYKDKTTLVDRSDAGEYSYCNKNKDTCSSTGSLPGTTLGQKIFDAMTEPSLKSCDVTTGAFQEFNYDPRYRPWYIAAKQKQTPYWTSPFVFWDPPDLGSTYVHPFYNTNDDGKRVFAGVLALDYKFLDIADFLSTNYEESETLVAVVEEASPYYLIATSEGGIGSKRVAAGDETRPCPEDGTEECKTVRVKVDELGDAISFSFATHAQQEFPDARLLPVSFDGAVYASQTLLFTLTGGNIKWRILILSPIEAQSADTIGANEALVVGILAPSLLGALVCSVVLGYVVWYRNRREIATSDWRFTGAFIFNCVLLNLACLSFIGENTDELCLLRMWLVPLCFVLALAPLLVKTHRMYQLIGRPGFNRQLISHTKTVLMMTPFIAVEVLILLVFTFVDPSKETEVIEEDGSVVSYRVVCSHNTGAFAAVQIVYAGGLLLVGCFLAFKSRNMNEEFCDAKPLVIAMYNIALVSSLVLIVAIGVDIPAGQLSILVSAAVAWSTIFSSSVFVLPRLLQGEKRKAAEKKASQLSSQQPSRFSAAASGAVATSVPGSVQHSRGEEKEEEA